MIHQRKPFWGASMNVMSLSKFFSSLLLLLLPLLALCRPTALAAQPLISPSPSPSPSPSADRLLPQEEVDAVNALLRLSVFLTPMSRTECSSPVFDDIFTCDCNRTDSTNCRVIKIVLSNWRLRGRIPDEIGVLSQLTSLELSKNSLFGPIPSSFVNLSQLSTLDLSNNNLEGPLSLFSKMKSLQNLSLDVNKFNGSIPCGFGLLPSLEVLSLSNNLLSGSIPIELGNISSLTSLYLDDNLLTGQLPSHLGNLSNLTWMSLNNNEFSGALPSEFGKLESMVGFIIQGNSISGTIPSFIANWRSLEVLALGGNNFEGPLPSNISALRNLTTLYANNLPGSPGGSSFPEISNAINLYFLTLRNCSLTGRIPDYIGQLPALYALDLSFNNLCGGIPPIVKNPPLYIFLRRNKLNGSLPGWMLSLNKSFVDVSENLFSNTTISGTISPNTNLFECCSNISDINKKWQEVGYHCADETLRYDHLYINCGGDQTSIEGSLYEADSNKDGASNFSLSNNKTWGYSSMGAYEKGDDVYIVNMPNSTASPLYDTARASAISVKYYGFCLKNGSYRVRLHFAEIVLQDTEPSHKKRRVFDVEIQGQKVLQNFNIEAEAGGIRKTLTREFPVSINDSRLEIHLYWAGKGSLSGTDKKNGPLISAISVHAAKHKLSPLAIAGIVVGSMLLSVMLILRICWKLDRLGGKRLINKKLKGIELYPGGIFNFQEIRTATNNFAPENKIGEGGFGPVYKGLLPNGNAIAVKQLSAKSKQGAREFVNEIGTIYSLQHPNLVRLIGCCTQESQLLLMSSEEVKSKLNWETRVKVCLGIAKGLAFLHGESKLKIIHRDIKPTNVLLDKDFNAKISDFGYALLNEEETTRVITQIAGTTGYMAPEYVQGFLTPKADVYSFGIVTLEVVSGKKVAISRPRDPTLYLLDTAYDYLQKGNLIALVDPSLGSNYNHSEALKILHLAMQCVSPAPKLRPTMFEVVKVLQGKKKIKTTSVSILPDNSTMDKPFLAISESTQFQTALQTEASEATISHSTCEEIEVSASEEIVISTMSGDHSEEN